MLVKRGCRLKDGGDGGDFLRWKAVVWGGSSDIGGGIEDNQEQNRLI